MNCQKEEQHISFHWGSPQNPVKEADGLATVHAGSPAALTSMSPQKAHSKSSSATNIMDISLIVKQIHFFNCFSKQKKKFAPIATKKIVGTRGKIR